MSSPAPEDPRTRPVHVAGRDRAFGEVTVEDARAMASELKAAGGWGPMARVAAVARSWDGLARTLDEAGAATVADLDPDTIHAAAVNLWVIPPDQPLF